MEPEDTSANEDNEEELTWIHMFCELSGNEFYVEIDKSYIEDHFNLYGLRNFFESSKDYSNALDIILDRRPSSVPEDHLLDIESIQKNAELLYSLIHARYVLAPIGLQLMVRTTESHYLLYPVCQYVWFFCFLYL